MTVRRIFITACLLIIIGAGYVATQMPEYAARQIEKHLASAGFKNARVQTIEFAREGIIAKKIALDSKAIDQIDILQIKMDWLTRRPRHIDIIKPSVSFILKDRDIFPAAASFSAPNLPDISITIRNATIDLSTELGILRFQGSLTFTPKDSGHDIKGQMTTQQLALSFDTKWTGTVKHDGRMHLSAQVEGGQIKTPMFQVNRGYGWLDIASAPGSITILSELESGSGKISGLPVQDIYMALRGEKDRLSLIGRSYFTGEKNTRLSLDSEISPDQSVGQIILQTDTPNSLLSRLFEEKIIPEPPIGLKKLPSLTLRLRHQPERRFQGGPLPFELSLNDSTSQRLSGNILFYPDEYMWRGTVQGDADLTDDVALWLGIPKEKSGKGFFRIEKSMERWVPGIAH